MFATGGYTTNQVEAHFDSVIALANKPDFCLIYTGANTDTTAQIGVYAMVRIIKKLMAASILPVIGVAQGGTAWSLPDQTTRPRNRLGNFLRALSRGATLAVALIGAGDSRLLPIIWDPTRAYLDTTTSTQHLVQGRTDGGLYPLGTGAYNMAKVAWEAVSYMFAPRYAAIDPGDTYEATEKPNGNLLAPSVIAMTGTGSSGYNAAWSGSTTTTFSGIVPDGFEVRRGSGRNSTFTINGSLVPMPGHVAGRAYRTVVDVTAAARSGGNFEQFEVRVYLGTMAALGSAVGDKVEFEAFFRFTGQPVLVRSVELTVGGGTQGATLGKQSGTPASVADGSGFPQVAHADVLRSDPLTLTTSGDLSMSLQLYLETTTAGAHAKLETWGWSVRKAA